MFSINSPSVGTASSALLAAILASRTALAGTPATCLNPQTSCQNTTSVANLCCFNAPGGQLLQTQFWDTDPVTGPANSWTIHGLWPDNCDGTYEESCDSSRDYTGITATLTAYGETELLDYMNTFWISDDESNEAFWEHEWSTHGTCINTLDPSCYTNYEAEEEMVDFFGIVVDLFQELDTYNVLADAGITPSNTKTYTTAEIQAAIKASFGYDVYLDCSSSTLSAMYYAFDVTGSVQTGTFVPTNYVGSASTCPSTGIKYPVKSGASSVTTTYTAGSTVATGTATATGTTTTTAATTTTTGKTRTKTTTSATATSTGAISGSGYFQAYTSGSNTGCLISEGTWYVGGTCATYDVTASGSGFTMTSSKGSCGVVSNEISCASGVTADVFTVSNGLLAYNGETSWYSTAIPSGSTQEGVYTTSKKVAVTFEWQSI